MLRTLRDSISAWADSSPYRAALLRYLGTVLVMTAVIGLCSLSPFAKSAWFIVIMSILACSWFGGVGPSLLAPFLLIMAIRIVQKDKEHIFDFSTKEITDLAVFLLLTAAVGWSGQVRRRAQGLTKRQAAQLLEEARLKDHFLATLAHELRNPLAPLRTGLELLQMAGDDLADKALVGEVRAMMQRQVDQLVRLIDDLLDMSRINTGKIELRLEQVELAGIIRDAVDSAQPHLRAGGHQFDLTIEDAGLVLDADPARLAQVVLNLLNNAAKFTPAGGQIRLSARRVGDLAEIRVRDNGIGISPEMLSRVFDMFTQVDSSLDRPNGGLGIGLSIVRTLVQMHGGTVSVHSDGAGQGSEFVVRLPVSLDEAVQARVSENVQNGILTNSASC